ncbi:hypothetical protein [Inhella proteolytica]|uniref:Uncharacterized protein n=1 Tax=Inhella proteolytica TaxID=2795029 RepID=A0A931NJQ2_9BURK|nr:hypothetical protein [Inhella proteolytica]MBH9579244.1 hypothetical protein [Inhella proteolytica]
MLSFLVSALTVVAMLLTLLTAGILGFYTARVPHGDGAMGLIVPFLSAILAGVAGLLALLCFALRGGLDSLDWTRGQAVGAALGAGLLLGLAIFGALLAWAEAPWARIPLLLNLAGLLLPLGAHTLLLVANAQGIAPLPHTPWGKGLLAAGAGALLAGALCGAAMLVVQWRLSQAQHAAAVEAQQERQAEDQRREALGPAGRLREDLARYSDDAPLWTLSAGLPFEHDASLRAIWIERALRVPHFGQELRGNLCTEHAIYRHGAAVLVAEMPAERVQAEAWSPWLAEDARRTAEDIRAHGLDRHGDDVGVEHALATARAAARLQPAHPELRAGLQALQEAVAAAPAHPQQQAALQALNALLN